MRNPILLAISTLALAACFMPASIDNRMAARDMQRIRAEAAAEWQRLDAAFARNGWRPAGEPQEGALEERYDESDEVRITLPAAGDYALVGICGSNCIDMDLVVRNSARERVAADLEPDPRPIAAFRGAAGERFTAVVTIPNCRRPPRHPQLDEDPRWRCIYYTRLYAR